MSKPQIQIDHVEPELWSNEAKFHATMKAVVSLIVLLVGCYIVLLPNIYGPDAEKWAFGAIGVVLGYWLNPSSGVRVRH